MGIYGNPIQQVEPTNSVFLNRLRRAGSLFTITPRPRARSKGPPGGRIGRDLERNCQSAAGPESDMPDSQRCAQHCTVQSARGGPWCDIPDSRGGGFEGGGRSLRRGGAVEAFEAKQASAVFPAAECHCD